MKKRLIIHIGTHKTGSTSIQAFFDQDRAGNLRRYGLYYPVTGEDRKHAVFSAAVRQCALPPRAVNSVVPSPADAVNSLVAEILESGADVALLSEEGLSNPNADAAENCASLAAHFDVSVLVILRRQDLFVESLYSQFVRIRGETVNFPEFAERANIVARLDYYSMLRKWEAVFGRDAIHVILFETPVLEAGLIKSIFNQFSIAATGDLESPVRNISPAREIIEVIRRINQCELTRSLSVDEVVSRNKFIVRVLSDHQIGSGSTRILGRSARRGLLERYQVGNAEIASRYQHRSNGGLFIDDLDEAAYPSETWKMPEQEIIESMAWVLAKLSAQSSQLKPRGVTKHATAVRAHSQLSSVM